MNDPLPAVVQKRVHHNLDFRILDWNQSGDSGVTAKRHSLNCIRRFQDSKFEKWPPIGFVTSISWSELYPDRNSTWVIDMSSWFFEFFQNCSLSQIGTVEFEYEKMDAWIGCISRERFHMNPIIELKGLPVMFGLAICFLGSFLRERIKAQRYQARQSTCTNEPISAFEINKKDANVHWTFASFDFQ